MGYLLICDPPIGLHCVASFLCPTIFLVYVPDVCGSLLSYPWDQQYFFCSIFSPLYGLAAVVYVFSHVNMDVLPWFFSASVVRVSTTILRLHNSACNALIWSSLCLNFVDRYPFVVVSSVNDAYRSAITDVKFIQVSSVSSCFTFLALSYPAAPAVYSGSSLSRYASWKFFLNRTHVLSLYVMLFHMGYTCVYSCVARILVALL